MLASRLGRLPLALSLIAFVVIGGPAVLLPPADADLATAAIDLGRDVTHAVDGTLADPADTRTGRTDRHAPRNDDLLLLVAVAVCATGIAMCGFVGSRSVGSAVARLRDSIGRRAPPALVTR